MAEEMSAAMSHQDYYRNNESYARFLNAQDKAFFGKYIRYLSRSQPGGKILDAGCGTGQVVAALDAMGFETYGIEVSEPNIHIAQSVSCRCSLYDGRSIPFDECFFDAVGSFNVLEHVVEPEAYLRELVRVLKPGGTLVLSSPNFLRVLGWRDYHWHMRGIGRKLRNARTLLHRWRSARQPDTVMDFERMDPVISEDFQPDDDAIVVTNLIDINRHLEYLGCRVTHAHCTDREVPALIEWGLNITPLKYLIFNAFVRAERLQVTKGASNSL